MWSNVGLPQSCVLQKFEVWLRVVEVPILDNSQPLMIVDLPAHLKAQLLPC